MHFHNFAVKSFDNITNVLYLSYIDANKITLC